MSAEDFGRCGFRLDVKFCASYVVSDQRPSSTWEVLALAEDLKSTIGFDEEGVCDACRNNDVKISNIDWDKRDAQIFTLAPRLPGSRGGCTDLIGSSRDFRGLGFVSPGCVPITRGLAGKDSHLDRKISYA